VGVVKVVWEEKGEMLEVGVERDNHHLGLEVVALFAL
jgi:hypothetical protein